MPQFKKCVFVDDLIAVTLYACLAILFVLVPPFNKTFLRVPLVLPLFIFIPGYSFISALFPGNEELKGIERFTLSVAFSLMLVIFDGFLISILPWGCRPGPIVTSILGMTAFFSIIAIFTRKLQNECDQFSISISELIRSIESKNIDNNKLENLPTFAGRRHFQWLIYKVKENGSKSQLHVNLIKKHLSFNREMRSIIGLTVFIVIFIGVQIYLISMLPQSPHFSSIVISLLGTVMFLSVIAIFARKPLERSCIFSSISDFIKSIRSDNNEFGVSEEISGSSNKRLFHRLKSKVEAKKLKPHLNKLKVLKSFFDADVENVAPQPETEKMLIIALIVSIVLISGMQVYAKSTQEKEAFTTLYLLGPEGKAEGYPTESLISVPITATVGIENHELQDVNYVLQMKADDKVIEELNLFIKNGETLKKDMIYTREKAKAGRSKLEFALFKEKADNFPYRSVYLYLKNNNTVAYVGSQKYTEVPEVENGEMELSTGWEFTSSTDRITGSYLNNSGVNSSFAYDIANVYEGNLSFLPEYGEISQNIQCTNDTMVLLSAYVKSSSGSSTGTGNQTKYIAVNGETVWTERVSGNKDWKHVIVPLSLHAGSNNLALGLSQTEGEMKPIEILWDDISFESLANISMYPSNASTLEAIPPTSTVLLLPAYTNSKTFYVSWNGTDDSSGIAYYSIDVSIDGVNWQNWIPKITDNSSVFTGEENQTYYFRSRATDSSGNDEPVHVVPDTHTKVYTGTPLIIFDITPNPCKSSTSFNVTSTIPLKSVVCIVTQDGFSPTSGELASSDGVTWKGGYVINRGNHFYVEAICTDYYGNTKSIMNEIVVDNSLPDFEIEINSKSIDLGDLEIKITPSVALKDKPLVTISNNNGIEVAYLRYSEGSYFYKAKIKSEASEGEHIVYASSIGLDSESIGGNATFVVDHTVN